MQHIYIERNKDISRYGGLNSRLLSFAREFPSFFRLYSRPFFNQIDKGQSRRRVFERSRRQTSSCRVGTVNVRSLKSSIIIKTLVKDFESYHLDIFGVTETWLKGAGVDHLDNGYVIYRSGGSASRACVAVILHKRISNNVILYNFISERIVSVRLIDGVLDAWRWCAVTHQLFNVLFPTQI